MSTNSSVVYIVFTNVSSKQSIDSDYVYQLENVSGASTVLVPQFEDFFVNDPAVIPLK